MDYICACSYESIKSAAKAFGFSSDITGNIILLRDNIFKDEIRLREFLRRCGYIYEDRDFKREELRKWPLPEKCGSMYYYLMLFAGFELLMYRMYSVKGSRDIPGKVIEDTIKDISSDIEGYGKRFTGMPASSLGFRIYVNLSGEYFRLGRLAFHVNHFHGNITAYRNHVTGDVLVVKNDTGKLCDTSGHETEEYFINNFNQEILLKEGDIVLDIHIPGGEPMDIQSCKSSMKEAVDFFDKHFPEKAIKGFVCYSWLMDSRLKLLLKSDSNIVRFQDIFRLFPLITGNSDLLTNVFGYIPEDYNKITADTRLKKELAEKMKNNSLPKPGGGGCFLLFEDFY